MSIPRTVNCPTCSGPVTWNAGFPFRPFCSERCKMIDLGSWATESYRIPVVKEKDEIEGSDADVRDRPA